MVTTQLRSLLYSIFIFFVVLSPYALADSAKKKSKPKASAIRSMISVQKPSKTPKVIIGGTKQINLKVSAVKGFTGNAKLSVEHNEIDEIDKNNCFSSSVSHQKLIFSTTIEHDISISLSAKSTCPVWLHQHVHLMVWIQMDGNNRRVLKNVEIPIDIVKG